MGLGAQCTICLGGIRAAEPFQEQCKQSGQPIAILRFAIRPECSFSLQLKVPCAAGQPLCNVHHLFKEQEESPTRATANCHDSHVFVEQNNRFQAMGRQGLHSILSCIDNVGGSLRQFEHSSCPTRSCGLSPVRPTLPTLHSTPKRPLAPLRFPKLSPARALSQWPLLLNLRLLIRVCWSWSCGAE